jgi:hypothetical protein
MLGYLIWRGAGRPRVVRERRAIGGVWFQVLEVRGRGRRIVRRVRRAVEEMRADGVRRCVAEPDWPAEWGEGLQPVGEERLRCAILPQLLDWLAEQKGLHLSGATVELTAPWADKPVREAARLLSRRCRYLRLDMDGADALREELWRRYGIAAGSAGSPASLQICFGEPTGDAPALLLGPGCGQLQRVEYTIPEALTEDLNPYPVTPQLVAALWECGAVKTEEIRLKSLDFHA